VSIFSGFIRKNSFLKCICEHAELIKKVSNVFIIYQEKSAVFFLEIFRKVDSFFLIHQEMSPVFHIRERKQFSGFIRESRHFFKIQYIWESQQFFQNISGTVQNI
jgi:hypothetical protein